MLINNIENSLAMEEEGGYQGARTQKRIKIEEDGAVQERTLPAQTHKSTSHKDKINTLRIS